MASTENKIVPMSPFEEDECDLLSPSTRHSIRQLSCQSQALIDAIGNDTLISPPFARSNSSTPKSSGTVGKFQEEYDDDELNDELQRLGSVEEQLTQDLDNENADTMMSALKMISPLARFRSTRRTVLTHTKNEQVECEMIFSHTIYGRNHHNISRLS